MIKLTDIESTIWFADTEVFQYDNIWVFTQYGTGVTEVFVNDNEGVRAFCEHERPLLCGYNFRDYDQYILKACLYDMAQEDIKYINDVIIAGEDDKFDIIWDTFDGLYGPDVPPIIDLFHDIVPRRSLKVIEGNLGMSVKESSVPFDIDRPLTDEELEESVEYCRYDVYATSVLFEHRREYLQSKITLCEICGEDYLPMLKHSNARVLAEVFHAKPYKYDPNEKYVIPDTIDLSGIPQEVLDYVAKCDVKVATRETDIGKLEFLFHGVPTVFGIGGIHSADEVPYIEETTDDRVLLIQDITSYYPSLIIEYGYTSRAAGPECTDLYHDFYNMRVEAKARGDKETANAAKLVLNTYSGAMGGAFNKLYDPMKPLSMRLTGQLAIMDAVNCAMSDAPSARFIQLNTDGWVLSVNRAELDNVLESVAEWEKRTRFSVDTQFIKKLVQRDVNNYILEKPDGSVKVKGGTVSQFGGTSFVKNSLTICHEAIVRHLLYGESIADVIRSCDEMEKFQNVAKAGHTFDGTIWSRGGEDVKLHMCNRIFASSDKDDGMVYKYKIENGEEKRSKVPNCPEHAKVVNDRLGFGNGVPMWLDKSWYIEYATKKSREFVRNAIGFDGRKIEMDEKVVNEMDEKVMNDADTEKVETPKRKRTAKKTAEPAAPKTLVETILSKEPENLDEALFKLQLLMSGNSGSVKFDGYISNINYAYADTQQYKQVLAKCALDCGLIFGMDVCKYEPFKDSYGVSQYTADKGFVQYEEDFDRALNGPRKEDEPKRSKFIAYCADVDMHFTFFPTHESRTFHTIGFGVGTQGNAPSIAITNAMRNFITNNFLIDNKGRDGDDVAAANLETLKDKAESTFVSQEKKESIKADIVAQKKTEAKHATVTYAKALYAKLKAASEEDYAFAQNPSVVKALEAGYEADGTPKTVDGDENHSVLKQAGAAKLYRMAEAVIG